MSLHIPDNSVPFPINIKSFETRLTGTIHATLRPILVNVPNYHDVPAKSVKKRKERGMKIILMFTRRERKRNSNRS